uniref:Synaptogyrin 2 n=1 Tax=Equus asinus asinus TaxID=83772 RepID=A0A8C4L6X4_EQUAS
MESGAYGAAKAGGSFDLRHFLTQPQVVARAVCLILALIVFSCIFGEGYSNTHESQQRYCVFNRNEDACRYGSAIGVLAFLACAFFFVVDIYFPQISNATDRKYLVIGDLLFSALWTFLWFVGFCFLTNQWAATKMEDVRVGADSARAAITFSFFSIFSWVGGPGGRVMVSSVKGGGGLRNPNLGLPAGCAGLPGLPALQGWGGRLHPELRGPHSRPQLGLRLLPGCVCGQLPAATLYPERRDH